MIKWSKRQTLYNWLTHPYRLIMRDEERLAEHRSYPITRAKLLAILVPLTLIIFFTGFTLASYMSRRASFNTLENQAMRRQILQLHHTLDSLHQLSQKHADYLLSLQKIVFQDIDDWKEKQEKIDNADKKQQVRVAQTDSIDLDYISPEELALREAYEAEANKQQAQLYYKTTHNNSPQLGMLFPPLQGLITEKFDMQKRHYGIDIVAKSNTPIHSVAEGTVVLASWTDETGYVIAIQHANELLSVYKHNDKLLKKVGDIVRAGEAIAIIGNTGKYSTGPHLHFELWLKGHPVNPERLIVF